MSIDAVTIAAMAANSLVNTLIRGRTKGAPGEETSAGPDTEAAEAITRLVRERLAEDPDRASALTEVEQEPENPEHKQHLQDTLVDLVVMDDVFAGKLERLIAADSHAARDAAEEVDGATEGEPRTSTGQAPTAHAVGPDRAAARGATRTDRSPVRGFPGLTVAATSPQTTAGSDFLHLRPGPKPLRRADHHPPGADPHPRRADRRQPAPRKARQAVAPYPDFGIRRLMPSPWLCRVGGVRAGHLEREPGQLRHKPWFGVLVLVWA
jgi:hypothetical protein